jgi:hypothetical protein
VSQNESPLTLQQLEQYNDWLTHPVTLALNHYLRSQRELLKEQWANGAFTAPSVEQTALLTANAVGQCEVLNDLLDLEPSAFFPEQAND